MPRYEFKFQYKVIEMCMNELEAADLLEKQINALAKEGFAIQVQPFTYQLDNLPWVVIIMGKMTDIIEIEDPK